ncbi:MAG: OmpA family protein, partial [Bacteroidetes bacterium]|nr:OmpA family protein [Bacteroidota bacterium]
VNRKLEVQPISFFTGSSNLTKSSKDYLLNTLVSFLKESPQIKLKVTGHTDNIGNDAVNLQLSISRARKVVEFLQSNGIDKDRLRFEGYGKAKPIADNATVEGRTKNRRVEFEITAQ